MDSSNAEVQGNAPKDPWISRDGTAKELKDKHQPVDYAKVVGDNRVLFFAENHSNHSIRRHLARNAHALKTAGITHYAIEAKEQGNEVFEQLNRGESVDLSRVDVGPGRHDYEDTIRAMAAQGIKVVAVDIDQSTKPTNEEREARMTANLKRILDEDPDAKVAYLVGGFHASKKTGIDGMDMTGKRLADADIPLVIVNFAGGELPPPTSFTDGAREAGLASEEFMIDMRSYADSQRVPYGAGKTDYIVHLPQEFQAGIRGMGFGGFSSIMETSLIKTPGISDRATQGSGVSKLLEELRAKLLKEDTAHPASPEPKDDTSKE